MEVIVKKSAISERIFPSLFAYDLGRAVVPWKAGPPAKETI
jgi:hypothetical protein